MDYIQIGKIVAAHGIHGDVILKHGLGKQADFTRATAIFVEERKGSYVPWFAETAKAKSEEETYLRLEGIASREAAAVIIGRQVWLKEADFRKLSGKAQPISLLGYTLTEQQQPIGIIEEVIEQPHQLLVRTTYEGNEAYIPLHQESLVNIIHAKRIVEVRLPDGLLEIYKGG
jgi:16S rRNA processing protein RimM